MTDDRERELYDRYLDALGEHAEAANELRAAERRHILEGINRIVAMVERLPLKRAEQATYRHYQRARKTYEDYRRTRVESDT